MVEELRYLTLRREIMRKIYEGAYGNGEALPSERALAEDYQLSRVTVRKALERLEKDGIIRRKLGAGTTVQLTKQGYRSDMDIIALVAPAQRRFFALFIDYFQRVADRHQSLLVFIQRSQEESIEDTLFKLLQNNIHNAVIWLDYETLQSQAIGRLRGLGMNLVLFDITVSSSYADCVCLDNFDAIRTLYSYAAERSPKGIAYVTREDTNPSSYRERQQAFEELSDLSVVWSFPWDFKNYFANRTDNFVFDHFCTEIKPECVICSDGELGIALKKALIEQHIRDVLILSVDDFPECEELGMTTYRQPYDRFAETIFRCMNEQNFEPARWKAGLFRVKGDLVVRE